MNEPGNPIRELNPEQLLSYVAELMCEHQKKSCNAGYLIYYHEELKIVTSDNVPTSAEILNQFTNIQLTRGLCTASWNNLRETLGQLQHEVLCCNLKSKLLTTKKQVNSSTG